MFADDALSVELHLPGDFAPFAGGGSLEASVTGALDALSVGLGLGRVRVDVAYDGGSGETPAIYARVGGIVRAPSTSAFLRAGASALGRFVSPEQLEASMVGALRDPAADDDAVRRGIVEVFAEIFRADPSLLFTAERVRAAYADVLATVAGSRDSVHDDPIEPWSEGGLEDAFRALARSAVPLPSPSRVGEALEHARDVRAAVRALKDEAFRTCPADVVVFLHDDDYSSLLVEPVDLSELFGEVERLVADEAGVPIRLRLEIDPAVSRSFAEVRIRGLSESAIPLLPRGVWWSKTPISESDTRVVPAVGLAFYEVSQATPGTIDRVWSIGVCLLEIVRERLTRLIDRRACDDVYEKIRLAAPRTFVAAIESVGRDDFDAIVNELVDSRTPIGDVRALCEAIVDFVPLDPAPPDAFVFGAGLPIPDRTPRMDDVVRYVRTRMASRIAAKLMTGERLEVHLLDERWRARATERLVALAPLRETNALGPDVILGDAEAEILRASLRRAIDGRPAAGFGSFVLLTPALLRGPVAAALKLEFPQISVIGFDEVPDAVTLFPLSRSLGAPSVPAMA